MSVILPPVILPGGGRFKTGPSSGVLVSIQHQTAPETGDVIRWRFTMNQTGRSNCENGPTIEGQIPARCTTPFEECYQFCPSSMGYRRSADWSHGEYNFEFGFPGIYRVFAWIERGGLASATQSCVFEIVSSDSAAPPCVSLGC